MLKDITLGQYYPTESVIHRLIPGVTGGDTDVRLCLCSVSLILWDLSW